MTATNDTIGPQAAERLALKTQSDATEDFAGGLRPANKTRIFDALSVAGITLVLVSFDGYGDSGQIENITVCAGENDASLPDVDVEFAVDGSRIGETVRRMMSVRDAIEQIAYDLLWHTQLGWENDDGACGEFTFDVADRTITLDFSQRYTSYVNYSDEF